MTFYYNDGKGDVPYKWKEGEFKMYSKICLITWGCLPYNVSWAVNTSIFNRNKDKFYEKR